MRMEIQRSQKWSVFNAVFHDGRFHKEEPKRGSEESITLKGFNFVNIFLQQFREPTIEALQLSIFHVCKNVYQLLLMYQVYHNHTWPRG